jgi:hypothetical protein
MNKFDWGNETSRDKEARYRREMEELWQHAARVRAARSARSGRSGRSGRGGKGGASDGEGKE